MPNQPQPLPVLGVNLSDELIRLLLNDYCHDLGYKVVVSSFSIFRSSPGKRSFLVSFDTDRAANSFARTHGLTTFGFHGVLVLTD